MSDPLAQGLSKWEGMKLLEAVDLGIDLEVRLRRAEVRVKELEEALRDAMGRFGGMALLADGELRRLLDDGADNARKVLGEGNE